MVVTVKSQKTMADPDTQEPHIYANFLMFLGQVNKQIIFDM